MSRDALKNKSTTELEEYKKVKSKCGHIFKFKFCNFEMLNVDRLEAFTRTDKLIRLHEILAIQLDEYQRLVMNYEEIEMGLLYQCNALNDSVKLNALLLKDLLLKITLAEKKFINGKNNLCKLLNDFLKKNPLEEL